MTRTDTTDEAAEVQASVFRAMSPVERLQRAFDMSVAIIEVAEAGLRSRHPDYSDEQAHLAMLRLRLGDDLFCQALPDAPLLAL